jgi:hypothetical protein
MSEKNNQSSMDILSELPEGFDNASVPADKAETPQPKTSIKKNLPRKRASRNSGTATTAEKTEKTEEAATALPTWSEEELANGADDKKEDSFFDILSFSGKNKQEPSAKSEEFEATKFSVTDSAELKLPKQEEPAKDTAVKKEEQTAAPTKAPKKKKSFDIVQAGLKITQHSDHAKLIFILCMILLAPIALLVTLAVLLLFLAAGALTVLAAGVMAITVLAVVVIGVIVAMVGIAYGAIILMTGEGFSAVVGQYEMGLGIAIAGITVVVSALLYSGITDLVPYLFKKMGKLFKFLVKKTKNLIVRLYKYSTQL